MYNQIVMIAIEADRPCLDTPRTRLVKEQEPSHPQANSIHNLSYIATATSRLHSFSVPQAKRSTSGSAALQLSVAL
jgi:hypothetical protein